MERQTSQTSILLPQPSASVSASRDSLIRFWILRFQTNAGQELTANYQESLVALWKDSFADLSDDVLNRAFQKTLNTCKYWPKVADIRAAIDAISETATAEAAEIAWRRVLDLRRLHWNPDIPGELSRQMALLPEQIRQAVRAAGIFHDFESMEALHVWAKKRFIESYLRWSELEHDEFLLPDGELKNLLADAAQQKALPDSQETWQEMRARGLAYAAQLSAEPRRDAPKPRFKIVQSTRSLEEQKRILREKGFQIN